MEIFDASTSQWMMLGNICHEASRLGGLKVTLHNNHMLDAVEIVVREPIGNILATKAFHRYDIDYATQWTHTTLTNYLSWR